ncbi:MAG TPA: hypothetical protein VF439_02550 [Candidatus Paceibacterota bacterium]
MPKGEQGFPPPKPQKRKESADDFALEALAAHDYEQSLKPASTRRAENADEKLPGGAADTGEKGYASIPREDSKDGSPIEATVGENRKQLKGAVEELINYQEVSPPPSFEDVRPGDMASYVGNAPADNRGVEHWTDPDPTHVIRQHTAANKAATAADFEQIRTDALEKFDASSKRILDESFGKKEEPVKAGVKTGTEPHTVPTYEQMNPKGTLKEWVMGREWVMRRNQELDKKAEGLGVGAFIKGLGEKYNKIPWQWKVGIGAALLAGTIATGGVGPLATAFAALSAGRRIAGGLGTYATVDGLLQRSYDKKARIWNSPGGRFLISATAGVLAGGALGYFLHHEAGIPAGSDEGKHARDFLAKNWPGTGAGHGVGAMHVAPIDIPAEPPGIPFHHVDAVVAHKGMGGIKLFSGLQEHLAAAYGDGPRPPSVQHILNLKPEELAKQYGFYKPDGTLDSARIIDGSALGMDDHGNVVFTPKGGSSSVLSIADKFGGRFFDSHHGAGLHHGASVHGAEGHAAAAVDEREVTKRLNETMSARTGVPGHYEYMSAKEGVARDEAWRRLQEQHAPKPTFFERLFGAAPSEHAASGAGPGDHFSSPSPADAQPDPHSAGLPSPAEHIDLSRAGIYPDKHGTPIAFGGGSVLDRTRAAMEYVAKHHDAKVYFDSSDTNVQGIRVPHLSVAYWDEATQSVQAPNEAMDPSLAGMPLPTAEDLGSSQPLS